MELARRLEMQYGVRLSEDVIARVRTPRELILALDDPASVPPRESAEYKPPGGDPNDPAHTLIRVDERDWQQTGEATSSTGKLTGKIGYWLFGSYAWLVGIVLTILALISLLITPGESWRHRLARMWCRLLFLLTATPLRLQGTENLSTCPACIMVANHISYLDGLALTAALPVPIRYVVKRELAGHWLSRTLLDRVGVEYVDRFDIHQRLQDAARLVDQVQRGHSLTFFPEGTFIEAPGLQPFRMGAFVTAAHAGIPVVPVAIRGTREIVRGSHWFPRRGAIDITVLPPVLPPGNDWDAALRLREQTREKISRCCGEPDLLEPERIHKRNNNLL
jgi:1-acyl-sn-glycerol-3-phosphate acyltransferase